MARNEQTSEPVEVMVVNDSPGEECRIAIVRDGRLQEFFSERPSSATNVNNIYKGRVTNVEPAIQAAFVDYGQSQSGFLHISDLHPRYFPGEERTERVGKRTPRRQRPLIQDAMKRGDELLVQVLKEGIGTKGPTLTSYLSIPGRLMVAMPDMDRVGVSRKVEDPEKRRAMRDILDSLDLPEDFGFILRTAGFGSNKTELKRDLAYLMRLWKTIENRMKTAKGPTELYVESDLLIRSIRDLLRPSIEAIVVDSDSGWQRASDFLHVIAPRSAPKVLRYRRPAPIFHAFDIERQIDLIHSREVPLPSGGAIVIDQTEALVAIDVNSGRSRSARDSETNAYRTNCEAVDEICRQLRLRDLGGLIVHDLIDMRLPKHRREIEERFRDNLKLDRAKSTTLRISEFGLVQMTRQRMRPSMRKSHFVPCSLCDGRGEIKSPESVGADCIRQVEFLLQFERVVRVQVVCSAKVASVLLSGKRRALVELEADSKKKVVVHVSDAFTKPDLVEYYAYDDRNADIDIARLPAVRRPVLAELEKEDAGPSDAAPGETRTKKVRRRRRGRKSADADAIDAPAEAGVDSSIEESAEPAPPRKKSRRKRRRKGESAGAESAPGSQDSAQTSEPRPRTQRVHLLAKELGVTSREVLERCGVENGMSLKNHMSVVSTEDAAIIRGLFATGTSGEPVAADSNGEAADAKPKRKRPPRRRRRGSRGGGGGGAKSEAAAAPEAAEAAPVVDAADAGESEPTQDRPARRSRRRRRKPKAAADAKPAPVITEAPEVSVEPAAKTRRTLYRNRKKVVPGIRTDENRDE